MVVFYPVSDCLSLQKMDTEIELEIEDFDKLFRDKIVGKSCYFQTSTIIILHSSYQFDLYNL